MRALVFRGFNRKLSLECIPDPTPGPGEVVLKVHRCGICGTDLHRTESNIFSLKPGAVPGHEFAGEVVALGSGVSTLRVGDRVTALPYLGCNACMACLSGAPNFCTQMRNVGSDEMTGGYAEYVAVGAPWCVKLPQALSMEDGALVEPLAVGLHAIVRAGLKAGDRVAVIGAGPIGLAAIWWARRAGAGRIVATATSDRRAALARDMGADAFLAAAPGESPANAVVEALGGGADIVFECVGLPGLLDQAIACAKVRGVVAVLGVCVTRDPYLPLLAMAKEVDVRFSVVYDLREFQHCVDALDRGDVAPRAMITDRATLDEAPDAFEALRSRTRQCKVMISPWS